MKKKPKLPVQVIITDRNCNLADLATTFLSFQSVVNEFYEPGTTGLVQPKAQDEKIPFAYFTADYRVKRFYNLDLFNAAPKIAQRHNIATQFSKTQEKIDSSNIEQLSQQIAEYNDVMATAQEIKNLQAIIGGMKKSPTFEQHTTYVLGACAFIYGDSPNDLPHSMQKIIDSVTGTMQSRTPDENEEKIRYCCHALLGYTILDHFVPKVQKKQSSFDYKGFSRQIKQFIPSDNIILSDYFKSTMAAIDDVLKLKD